MKHKVDKEKVIGDGGISLKQDFFGQMVMIFCSATTLTLLVLGVLAIYAYVR